MWKYSHIPSSFRSLAFGAVLQGSLFGLVGMLPPKYSTLFMSGQGLAGIFAALASLLSILSEYYTSLRTPYHLTTHTNNEHNDTPKHTKST